MKEESLLLLSDLQKLINQVVLIDYTIIILGGVSMATSSITHNFVVSNPNSVKRFVAAIDEADRDRTPKQTLPGRQLTNPQEILALMSKRKKKHV